MTRLNQLLAISQDVRSRTEATLTAAHHTLQKDALLSGITRTYTPSDDEGEQLPSEGTLVQVSASKAIEEGLAAMADLFDITGSLEATNASPAARADVIVDGKPVITGATVPYLLNLAKKLVDIRTFISKVPVLDPASTWTLDADQGVYRSAPVQTTRTKKVPRAFTKAPATEHHPAQVEMFHEDVIVGTWTATKFSGAIPVARRNEILTRVDKLLAAVKTAREEANSAPVVEYKTGQQLVGYLLG